MSINIDMLDIAQTDLCNGDYLEVRETNSIGKLIGVYCGTNIPTTLPNVNTYWLKFRSDNEGVGRGFKLEYNYGNNNENSHINRGNIVFKIILFLHFQLD